MKKLLIVALLGAVAARAQVPDKTWGLKNGRFWKDLTARDKVYFLTGFIEGVQAEAIVKVVDYASGLSYGETVKGVDQFYEDPANMPVPILSAMVAVKAKADGVSPEELARRAAVVRKVWSDAVEKEAAEKAAKGK